ncbi:hypothetical protein JEOAER750_00163 [Jeotgalicoccus aerolatus]|uniref:Uncharacterized beta-barrel protein YwiB (DUF1934 family) n=1 Tax=Jeotgalicoccus aerolatus TaxID=709510 RepID=A0A1G9AZK5_9STAP|nr:DUF1934 family protein [Jeotgalicoccus aerolatus]MBP1952068.1 uncharacterized beta-barrel protein YwiB (DUF1934 family) [Jeotgalicoccus aerolatus]CAD2071120.1 hypothetical protein JEOAER750_00163 [Jeotgalicoccus aerolatus]SDK32015.1 Uncharacterized beta-barrel protein YwiB, DUF1934 family [Jeotgalicoccus aerolatus]GGE05695.1 hypothetical protein GCM10007273_17630 [Jeotgalicoccus aerolatus]HJG33263.1 DUF1934 family protein [Jeotgalicoccus aerolatus]
MTEKKTAKYKLTQLVFMHDEETKYEQQLDVDIMHKEDTYLRYTEALDEHELNVTVRLGDGFVKLQRRGIINMNFYFEEGVKTDTFYDSPAGRHHFEIVTHTLKPETEKLVIKYDLFEAGSLLGKYKYTLERI